MLNHFNGSKKNLSQKGIIPESGVGMNPIVVYLLNTKNVAMKIL